LMKTGSYGILNSTTPPSSAPAWTSCITGVGPGRHGIYGFIRLFGQAWDKSPSQGLSFNSSMSNEAKTIWEILGSIGKRNIAINVPLTSPPFEINGVMIAGFPHPEKAPLTYPEAFEAEISDYRADAYGIHLEEGKEEEFLSDVYDISRRREILALKLLDENDWDLFFVVFTIPDRIQHYFWKFMDRDHPLYTEESGSIYGDEIKKVYEWVDRILGEFMNSLYDDTSLIVMSDHGFRVVKKQVNGKVVLSKMNDDSVFVAYPTDNFGVKYRVKPRYPLIKNDETESMRKHFIERTINYLKTLEDPQSGTKIIEKVFTKDELFHGPHASAAPDIIAMEMKGYLFLNLVKQQGMNLIQDPPDPDFFSGFHQEAGIVFMNCITAT